MKKFTPPLFLILGIVFLLSGMAHALTAREIVEKSDSLPQPDTVINKTLMTIYTKGSVIEKEFTLESASQSKNISQALVEFIRPSKIKLLTHAFENKDDDQWLMMSSGKVKRITGGGKSKSFVNSHFCFEDLSSRKIDNYTYKKLDDATVLGTPCYKVEAVKKSGTKVYSKIIMYIRQSDYFTVQIDFFRKGRYLKRLENHDIRNLDGILTPYDMRMIEEDGKEWTNLKIESLVYNQEIDTKRFNKEALR